MADGIVLVQRVALLNIADAIPIIAIPILVSVSPKNGRQRCQYGTSELVAKIHELRRARSPLGAVTARL